MTAAVLRKELHGYIDTMPDRNLAALKPLLSVLAEDYWQPVIEPANQEEIAMIEEGMAEYRKNPSSFVPLESVK